MALTILSAEAWTAVRARLAAADIPLFLMLAFFDEAENSVALEEPTGKLWFTVQYARAAGDPPFVLFDGPAFLAATLPSVAEGAEPTKEQFDAAAQVAVEEVLG